MSDHQTRAALASDLIDAGLVVPTTQPGIVGFGPAFEDLIDFIVGTLDAAAAAIPGPAFERYTFPPVIPDHAYATTEYMSAFPQLAATVSAFGGAEQQLKSALPELQGKAPGEAATHFTHAGLAMLPAACHPLYAMLERKQLPAARRFEVTGRCFRREPSSDPLRLQAFRIREYVVVGGADDVEAQATEWTDRIVDALSSLGLDARAEVANDPFFGRTGRLLAAQQQRTRQKMEFVVDVVSDGKTTPVASVNRPGRHFGDLFEIGLESGDPIHTSCTGFGLERIAVAMLARHGFTRRGINYPDR